MNKRVFSLALVAIFIVSSFAVPLAYAHALEYGHGKAFTSSNLAEENAMYIIAFNPPKERRLYVTGIKITFPSGFDISHADVSMVFGLPTRRSTVTINPADNSILYDFGRRYRLRYGRLAMMFISNVTNPSDQGSFHVDVQLIKYGGGTYDITEDGLVFIRYVNGSMIQDQSIEGVDINPDTSLTVGELTVNGPTTTETLAVTGTVNSNLIPGGSYDLGSSSNEWANLYATNGYFSNRVQVGSTITITTDTISASGGLDIVTQSGNITITPDQSHDIVMNAYWGQQSRYVPVLSIVHNTGNPPYVSMGASIDMNDHMISDAASVSTRDLYVDYLYALSGSAITTYYSIQPSVDQVIDLGADNKQWKHVYSKYGNFSKAVEIGSTITIDGTENSIRSSDAMLIEVMGGSAPLNIVASNFVLDSSEADFFVNVDMNGNTLWDSTGNLNLAAASGVVHVLNSTLKVGSSIYIDNAANVIYSDNAQRFTVASANNQDLVLSAGSNPNWGNLEAYGYDITVNAADALNLVATAADVTITSNGNDVNIAAANNVNIGTTNQDISMNAGGSILQTFASNWVAQGPRANFTLSDWFLVNAANLVNITSPNEVEVNAGLFDVNAGNLDVDVTGATTLDTATFAFAATSSGAITTPEWGIDASGNAWFNGNVDLGNDVSTDTVTFNSKVDSDILPAGANYKLGDSSNLWHNVWAQYGNFTQQVKVGSSVLITTDTISASGGLTVKTASGNDMNIQAPSATIAMSGNYLTVDTNNVDLSTTELDLYVPLDMNGNNIYDSTGELNLADDVNLGGAATDTISFVGVVDTDIIPTGSQNLGSSTAKWSQLYVNEAFVGSTLHLYTSSNNDFIDSDNPLWVRTTGTNDISISAGGIVNVESIKVNGNVISTSSGNLVLDSATGTTQINDDLDLSGTLTASGMSYLNGGINVNSGKFTVDATTGTVHTVGDLDVDGTLTVGTSTMTISSTSSASSISADSALTIQTTSGDIDVTAAGDVNIEGISVSGTTLDLTSSGTLRFGSGNTLTFDSGNNRFVLSKDLQVGSSIYIDNTNNKIYSDNTATFVLESATDEDLTVSAPGASNINLNAGTGDVMVTGDVFPTLDDNYDLGSQTARWHSLYLSNALQVVNSASNYVTVDTTGISSVGVGLSINSGTGTVDFTGNNIKNVNMLYANQLLPRSTDKFIGSAGSHWSQLHVDTAWIYSGLTMGGNLDMNGNDILNTDDLYVDKVHSVSGSGITFYDSLLPSGTLDLGSSTAKWDELYVSTAHIGGTVDIYTSGGADYITASNALTIQTSTANDITISANGGSNNVVVNANNWSVDSSGTISAASLTTTGNVNIGGTLTVSGSVNLPANSITESMIARSTSVMEIPIPLVVDQQSITSATLSTLNGWHIWTPGSWKSDRIAYVYVELEYSSAGSGDIDLYDITNNIKLADLVAPSAATSHTITRVDVTSAITGLSSNTKIGIQAAGDGTNAITVYSAKLIVVFKIG